MLFKEDIESCINLKLTIKEMKLILDEIKCFSYNLESYYSLDAILNTISLFLDKKITKQKFILNLEIINQLITNYAYREDISWSKKQIRANIEMMGISTELDEIIDDQNRKGLFDSYARIKYYDFLAFHSKNEPFLCNNIERVIVEPCIELDETTGIEKYFMIIANHQTKTFNVGYIKDDNYCLKKEYCYSFPWSDEVVLDYHFSDVLKLIERYIDKGFKIDSSLSLDSTLEGKSFSFTIY